MTGFGREAEFLDQLLRTLLPRQHGRLNLAQVRDELEPLLELKGQPEALAKLDALIATVNRRLSA